MKRKNNKKVLEMEFADLRKKMQIIDLVPETYIPTRCHLVAPEVKSLIVRYALLQNRYDHCTAGGAYAYRISLRKALDLRIGRGILCRPAIELAIDLAPLCRRMKDGKKKRNILFYLDYRLNSACRRLRGRHLLSDVSAAVKQDMKKCDPRTRP
jgi:hypothetical protein